MTSLAKQLKRLEAPATSGVDKLRGSTASFLFDQKSRPLERETIFAIGMNGLEELEVLQPDFGIFRRTLFDDSSIRLERSVQTKDSNANIDAEVTSFLRLLSPFLLIKPAHKALEWLVHRFSVHLFNGDQLMDCALPYHDTIVFVRIVQLLDIERLPRWRFLLQCQKSGSPLSKLALFNRCQSDLDFLRHICQTTKDAVEVEALRTKGHLRTLINFYLSAVIGVLELESSVSEPLFTTLLPFLVHGVRSGMGDYVAASYVVLAQLSLKVKAVSDVWMPLLDAIFQETPRNLMNDAISCAVIICKTQALTKLPRKSLGQLNSRQTRMAIAQLSERAVLSPFTRLLLRQQMLDAFKEAIGSNGGGGVFKRAHARNTKDKQLKKFMWFVQHVRLTNDDVSHSVRILMTSYVRLSKTVHGIHQKVAVRMLELLEKRYSGDFDELLDGGRANRAVKKLVRAFRTNPKVASRSANRFLALNAPSAARRKLAVVQLAKEKGLDDDVLASYIVERLADDDPEVVSAVLNSKRLTGSVPIECLATSLLDVANKHRTMPVWTENLKLCADILAKIDKTQISWETHSRIIHCLLPILFNRSDTSTSSQLVLRGSLPLFKAILKVTRLNSKCHALGEDLQREPPSVLVVLSTVSYALVHAHPLFLKKHLFKLLLDEAPKWRDQKDYDGMDQFFWRGVLILLLAQWLRTEPDESFKVEYVQHFLHFLRDSYTRKAIRKAVARLSKLDAAAIFRMDHMDTSFFVGGKEDGPEQVNYSREASILLFALFRMMTIAKLPASTKEMPWLESAAEPSVEWLTNILHANAIIYNILMDIGGTRASILLFIQWRSTCFEMSKKGMLKFLMFLATSQDVSKESTIVSQLRSLHTLRALIAAGISVNAKLPMVPALLAALASNTDAIRSAALSALTALVNNIDRHNTFRGLLRTLEDRKAEIREDGSLLQATLATYFQFKDCFLQNEMEALLRWTLDSRTPDHIRDKLLLCLAEVDDPDFLLELIPTLDMIIESQDDRRQTATRHSIAQKIIRHFTPNSVEDAFRTSSLAFEVFIKALLHADAPPSTDMQLSSLQMTTLAQISKAMFASIGNDELQQEVVRHLIDLQMDNKDCLAKRKMAKVLKKITSNHGLLVRRELERTVLPVPAAQFLKEVKKSTQTQRAASDNSDDTLSSDVGDKRTIIILEALHGKMAKVSGQDCQIVPVLFAHLKRYLERRDPMATSEYSKQLVLSTLNDALQCADDGDSLGLGSDQFNIELVIDCIRTSSNSKTHEEALLLLALAAKRFPEHVVHNTMAIFTFMGESVVRKDDCSSFDVILRTVEAVVPAVIQNDRCDDVDKDVDDGTLRMACALTRVFVDAAPDIPEHRRLPLFSCLVSALGEFRYLWLTVAFVLERLVTYKSAVGSEKAGFSRLGVLEFCVQLSQRYLPSCQIASCVRLIDCLIQFRDIDDDAIGRRGRLDANRSKSGCEGGYLDLERHSPRLRRQLKLVIVEFVSNLLASRPFLNQVLDLSPDKQEEMMLRYRSLLEKVLSVAHAVAARLANLKADDPALIKYFKVLQHRIYELLDKLSSLLPSNLFVEVIDQLIREGEVLVRRKALEILSAKLQHRGDDLDKPDRASLKRVVPTLLFIVQSMEPEKEDVQDEVDSTFKLADSKTAIIASNRQLSLLCLKYLCRQLGAEEPHLFRRVLHVSTTVVQDPNEEDNVRAGALLYVAEHCHSVRLDAITHLSTFVPALLSVLDRQRPDGAIQRHELLLLSAIGALHKVVEKLAPFLSPYVTDILQKVCQLSSIEPDNSKSPLVDRLTTIRSNLALAVPARVLIPAVKLCFETFSRREDGMAMGPLMATLSEYIANAPKEDLALWHSTLFAFYLVALDYRSKRRDDNDETNVSNVEGFIIEPMLTTILKMSEVTFRPFFIKLFDWAVSGDGPSVRLVTFYRIADRIADKLKSLFILFAGHMIKNASVMLDRNNLSKTDDPVFADDEEGHRRSGLLVHYILSCLHKCFLYDNEGFMTKERFETLIHPVVDQLENIDGGVDYERLVVDCLAPCIARMAVASADDALWKPLNYQVLLKTRHQLPKVRFGALLVLQELTKSIGEDYVTLLPETIPFLAELMEDEKLEVEQQCQAVIADMEVVLGEPLQKYFSA